MSTNNSGHNSGANPAWLQIVLAIIALISAIAVAWIANQQSVLSGQQQSSVIIPSVAPITQIVITQVVAQVEPTIEIVNQPILMPAPSVTSTETPIPTSSLEGITLVASNKEWQPTSLLIMRGDIVSVEVISGTWSHGESYNTGEGTGFICAQARSGCVEPIPDFSKGALIGRISNYTFGLGTNTRIVAKDAGELLLRINDGDNNLSDNSGSLAVHITIER